MLKKSSTKRASRPNHSDGPSSTAAYVAQANKGERSPARRVSWRRRFGGVALILAMALGGAYGLLLWADAPLREVKRLLDADQLDQAAERLAAYLERRPQSGEALSLQARIAFRRGRFDETIQLYELVGASTDQDIHTQARAYLAVGLWSHALPLLEYLANQAPNEADVLYELTSARQRIGRVDEALESARQFASLPGQEARGYVYLGTLHGELQNHFTAAEMYAKVLEFDPEAADLQVRPGEFFAQYARMLLAAGDQERASRMAQRAAALEPTGETLELAGRCQEFLGNRQEALALWRQAVERDPEMAAPREALASDALERQDMDAALGWLQPLVNQSRPLQSSTAYLLQRSHQLSKNEEDAERWRLMTEQLRADETARSAIANVLREQPRSFWAEVLRAYLCAEKGNLRQAQTILQALAPNASDDPFVRQLAEAVTHGGALPSLDQLPFAKH